MLILFTQYIYIILASTESCDKQQRTKSWTACRFFKTGHRLATDKETQQQQQQKTRKKTEVPEPPWKNNVEQIKFLRKSI